jgi:peptidoglycan/LPS O-acetylase OafA/YrhL
MFKGIEGARGWLAWTVVFGHLVSETMLRQIPHLGTVTMAGNHAVKLFILISGFVITNLILDKREDYRTFILRRALRLYPAYLLGLALGIATVPLTIALHQHLAVAAGTPILATHQPGMLAYGTHLVLHLLLLHGMVSNAVLPNAQGMFLPPAWSLSLEWQFYLIAPFLLVWLRKGRVLTIAGIALVAVLYWLGPFHASAAPGSILATGWYFVPGMAARLLIDRIPRLARYPGIALIPAAALTVALIALDHDLAPLVAGLALLLYIRTEGSTRLLDGPVARYFGERSYAVYILHFPIIVLCALLTRRILGLASLPGAGLTVLLSVAATLAAAEMTYRWLERPIITFGKRLGGREPGPANQAW